MNTMTLEQNNMPILYSGIIPITRKMIRERAVELALIDGRTTLETSKQDWDQAIKDLRNEPKIDLEEMYQNSLHELEERNSILLFKDREIVSEHHDDQSLQSEQSNERFIKKENDELVKAASLETESIQRQIDE